MPTTAIDVAHISVHVPDVHPRPVATAAHISVHVADGNASLLMHTVEMYTRVGGVPLLTPGHVEEPPGITPFVPDVNPLPPEPDEIEVPLPPWVADEPGPYRSRS